LAAHVIDVLECWFARSGRVMTVFVAAMVLLLFGHWPIETTDDG
jgi:hypothetical protein